MILEIVKYGHPVLREKGARIERVTPELRALAADMLETMRAASGLGLAAQQVGRALLLAVIDVSGTEYPSELLLDGKPQDLAAFMPLVLVNPHLSNFEGEQIYSEGCLSVPDITAEIPRAAKVTVRAQTLDGKELVFDCTGLLARAAQHEVDHLNGILFIDRIDAAIRVNLAGKLKQMQKEALGQIDKPVQPAAANRSRRLVASAPRHERSL